MALECVFILKYGNIVHHVTYFESDVSNEALVVSNVCSHYILCLLRVHLVINTQLVSNHVCYSNTRDKFFGGKKNIVVFTVLAFESWKDYQLDTIWKSKDLFKGELVQIVHHDVAGSSTLLAWWLSVSSVTLVVASCPSSETTSVIRGRTVILEGDTKSDLNSLEGLTTTSGTSSGDLTQPGLLLKCLSGLTSSSRGRTFREDAVGRSLRTPLLGRSGRRTRLGSLCKLTLLVNGSPLFDMLEYLEAYDNVVKTYSDVMATPMWSPALLRQEELGTHLSEGDVIHLVIRMKKAIDGRSLCGDPRTGINSSVSTERGVKQEGSGLGLLESSIPVEIQVRPLNHNIVRSVYRIDADSCSWHGRSHLTSRHSDACGWDLRRNGSVTLTTIWTEAVEAAKANKLSADEFARQIKCEISERCAISGVIKNEDVCINSNSNCDFRLFIHRIDLCNVEVIDTVMY